MQLPVNEIFETLQGEGHFTGTPSVFVRLQGCPVGCPWCDTKHTWDIKKEHQVNIDQILSKTVDAPTYALFEVGELSEYIRSLKSRHVVITGGEPCIHDLRDLTWQIGYINKQVQIETSGTAEIRCSTNTWVTLSPKIDMPGGIAFIPSSIERADEIKMPVGKPADLVRLEQIMLAKLPRPDTEIWLQPLSQSEKATKLCMQAAREKGFKVSIQTHKYLGIR